MASCASGVQLRVTPFHNATLLLLQGETSLHEVDGVIVRCPEQSVPSADEEVYRCRAEGAADAPTPGCRW